MHLSLARCRYCVCDIFRSQKTLMATGFSVKRLLDSAVIDDVLPLKDLVSEFISSGKYFVFWEFVTRHLTQPSMLWWLIAFHVAALAAFEISNSETIDAINPRVFFLLNNQHQIIRALGMAAQARSHSQVALQSATAKLVWILIDCQGAPGLIWFVHCTGMLSICYSSCCVSSCPNNPAALYLIM